MTTVHERPRITAEARPFWESAARGALELPYCVTCAAWVWFPRTDCAACGSAVQWRPVSGSATLTSFTVERKASDPRWRDRVPYVIAHVTLDEGVALLSNVVDVDPEQLEVGARLRVRYEPTDDPAIAVPVFTPIPTTERGAHV